MKFNGKMHRPGYEVNDQERQEIEELKLNLLFDLDQYREWELENFRAEIEAFYTPAIQIELLERHKINTQFELTFNDYYYRENCFYLDNNGFAQITDNEGLFFSFVAGFKMLEDDYKGKAIARNIVKVRLIEFLTGIIKNGKPHYIKAHKKEYLRILKPWGFELFLFLDNDFEGVTAEEPKYTLIYWFLIDQMILKARHFKDYRKMVKKETDIKIDFVRTGKNISVTSDIYKENEPQLIRLKRKFEEDNNVEFK